MTDPALPRDFLGMCELHLPRPIRGRADFDSVVGLVDRLTAIALPTPDQSDYLETLTILIEAYEADVDLGTDVPPADSISLTFAPEPYTFVPVPGFTEIWSAPLRTSRGVYLWCLEFEGALLVNYVGKAGGTGGFEARLRTEHRDWEKGRYNAVVDIELMKRGVYRALQTPMTPEHLADQLRELRPLYRLVLIPLATDVECRRVEAGLIQLLREADDAFQYVANKDKNRAYRMPSKLTLSENAPALIGLTAPVPALLRETVAQARVEKGQASSSPVAGL